VDEISGIYRGMMIAIPDDQWIVFQQMSILETDAFTAPNPL
jgi:hypothetical protein